MIGLRRIIDEQRIAHLNGKDLGVVGQQIAADPGPQQFKRAARNAARTVMVAAVIDQKRLKRLEE